MDCVEIPGELRTKAAMDADIRTHRRTALVVNVRSRRGRRHYETVRRQLRAAGLDLVDAQPVAHPAQLPDTLAKAVNSGADLLVAGGGDGTMSAAARLLAHRDIASACCRWAPPTTSPARSAPAQPLRGAADLDRRQGDRRRPRPVAGRHSPT